jgi:hypothetical protein
VRYSAVYTQKYSEFVDSTIMMIVREEQAGMHVPVSMIKELHVHTQETQRDDSMRIAPASGRTSFAPLHIALDRGQGWQY